VGRKLDDQRAISERHGMRRDNKAAVGFGCESGNVLLDIIRVANGNGSQPYCQGPGRRFGRVKETDIGSCIRIEDKPGSFGCGCNLL